MRVSFLMFLRPYLQCWRCEKPLGCLQSILRLYLSDHLCLRVRVRVRVCLERVLFDLCLSMYIY